ncbi:hypothetical protein ACQEVG_31020 [Streptomyces sp. CA-135486]|uniref:hypothetical protein n=1 Tax=Streptomyces sp. CA-135486 TaxID=3240049 RepID=UPI003D8A5DF2
MTVQQLPVEAGAFAQYLKGLTGLLDRESGWYGIFWQRDPDGMRACLDGVEIPPWDVVESLLQDFALGRGALFAQPESMRARQLHAAAAAAHDRRPGGREALQERLELMLREETYATGRSEELLRRLAGEPEGSAAAEQLAHELDWTRDDYARATARVVELTARLHALGDASGGDRAAARRGPEASPGAEHEREPDGGSWGGPVTAVPDELDDWFRPGSGTGMGSVAAATAGPRGADAGGWEHAPDAYSSSGGRYGAEAGHDVRGVYSSSGGPAPTDRGAGALRPDLSEQFRGAYSPSGGPAVSDVPAAPGSGRPVAGGGSAHVRDPHDLPGVPDDWFRPEPASPEPVRTEAVRTEAVRTEPAPEVVKKKRRPRGARFAGVEDGGDEAVAVPVLPPVGGDAPRGARFGGVVTDQPAPAPEVPAGAQRAARETVAALGRLRAEGRSGEAHALLCEAAARPAPWLSVLAAELHRAGLDADWATLLWEVASQPALRLSAAAGALAAAGRVQDSGQLLRQGVTRPADDIAAAVLALEDEGRDSEARALLTAFVQVHAAEDTAHLADRDPHRLVPQLVAAARTISASHERDLVHALRVAGHLGA